MAHLKSIAHLDKVATRQKKLVRRHKVSGTALTMCCRLKVLRLFSSLSREMLTFSRLIQHNPARGSITLIELEQLAEIVVVCNEYHYWISDMCI